LHTEQAWSPIRDYFNLRHVLLDLFYVVIISTLIAVFLTVTGISRSFLTNFVMSLSFGVSIASMVHLLLWIFSPKPEKAIPIVLILVVGVVCGMVMGLQIGPFILRHIFSTALTQSKSTPLQAIVFALAFGGTVTYFFYSRARLKVSKEIIQQERIKRLSSEKEALEANLRLLQAQIEPHFLFNTLSNVLSLIDTDPANGKSMLVDLIHYLRTSLSRTFPEPITLDQEIDMIKAYLNIQKIRMGERLYFKIELSEATRQHPFPPMLLQPLVENAVKHGLEPKMEGGEIMIKAMQENNLLRIEVIDTGFGFSSSHEAGVGIGNVRERIKLLYGEKGRFILEENKPNGVRAIIEVPTHDVQSHHR
jgi:sensor histidine kinase YesM